MSDLAARIEKRIRDLPARNPSYVSFYDEKLGDLLSDHLIREIIKAIMKEIRKDE